MAALTYAQSGVDREKADRLVNRISSLVQGTLNKNVKSSVGGYASLYQTHSRQWIAASTDGVGTKLKLATRLNEHRTVGIDLVAMCVNDLLCVGAEPFFFLDYFATGKLETHVAEQVIEGMVEGCRQGRLALVGGETAEMPDMYGRGDYDLAGFAVGGVDPKNLLPVRGVRAGDVLIGLASSGCHSNGYSLLRRLIPDGSDGDKIAAELLTPTQIYVSSVLPLIEKKWLKGLAHITGSGFLNVPRISTKWSYEIELPRHDEVSRIFGWVREQSGLSLDEMAQTWNMGVGMVLVVEEKKATAVLAALHKKKQKAWRLGHVVRKRAQRGCEVLLRDPGGPTLALAYD